MNARSDCNLLALDVGERRIGVARAHGSVGIAGPLLTLDRSGDWLQQLRTLVTEHETGVLIVGLPRGLDGQETAQTKTVREFAAQLAREIDIPIRLQDEALTSRKAEAELTARGKPFARADIDALAATYILEDYLAEHRSGSPHVSI